MATRARRSIDTLVDDYLSQLGGPKRRATRTAVSLDLLRGGLNHYAYQNLGRADSERWSTAFNEGNEDAFSAMFGAAQIAKYLDEFLGYFMIRKVLFSEKQVAETVEDVRAFVEWLAAERELTPTTARKALGRIAEAAADLPAAERLGKILYDLAEAGRRKVVRGAEPAYDEVVEDFLVIERVAPGRITFLGGVGPIKVPEAGSAVARPGWTVNIVLGRRGDAWEVLEVGNVYPETLA